MTQRSTHGIDTSENRVLSDTHGLLRQEVLDHLSGSDAVLHVGDISNRGYC